MYRCKRPVIYQIKTRIENVLPKFDMDVVIPQTGSRARDVSSLSQTSTISERLGGEMVVQEKVKVAFKKAAQAGLIFAKVDRPIKVMHTEGIFIILPGTIIKVDQVEEIGLLNGLHFSILPTNIRP